MKWCNTRSFAGWSEPIKQWPTVSTISTKSKYYSFVQQSFSSTYIFHSTHVAHLICAACQLSSQLSPLMLSTTAQQTNSHTLTHSLIHSLATVSPIHRHTDGTNFISTPSMNWTGTMLSPHSLLPTLQSSYPIFCLLSFLSPLKPQNINMLLNFVLFYSIFPSPLRIIPTPKGPPHHQGIKVQGLTVILCSPLGLVVAVP